MQDFIRQNPQRHIDDFFGVAHLEIQLRHDILAKAFDIVVLNVPAIAS